MHLTAAAAVLAVAAAARAQPAPLPAPPPPPRSPFVWIASLGFGAAHVDAARTSCPACDVSPFALDLAGGVGARAVPRLAIGVALDVQVQFVDGLGGSQQRLDQYTPYLWASVDVDAQLQVFGGVGYAWSDYEYTVCVDDILFGGCDDDSRSDDLGKGAAVFGGARYVVHRYRRVALALEAKVTVAHLGAAGTRPSLLASLAVGRF